MQELLAYIPPPPTSGFHLGPLYFHLYGLCIALGILAAVALAQHRWELAGHDRNELDWPMFWAVVAGFAGGRLGYIITHSGDYRGRWLHLLYIWEGGLALYGGLTLGILTGIYVAWRRGLPVLAALDAAIPSIPLAQAFGRWGNYFNQELFGTPSRLPWALRVDPDHRPDRYLGAATFHPTFLYESLYDLVVVVVLLRVSAKRVLRTGSLVLLYVVLYGFGRFWLELLRTDTTFRLFGLSRNAWVSLLAMVGGSAWLYLRERGGRAPVEVPAAEPAAAGGAERGPAGAAAAEAASAPEAAEPTGQAPAAEPAAQGQQAAAPTAEEPEEGAAPPPPAPHPGGQASATSRKRPP